MKTLFYLIPVILSNTPLAKAQTNYVSNTANSTTPGNNNTLVGPEAGNSTGTGVQNVFVGYQAGINNMGGSLNVFSGAQAGKANNHGFANVFTGFQAGQSNTSGNNNTFIGGQSGLSNTTGGANTFLGSASGLSNMTGSQNTFIGYYAGQNSTTASNNTFIGTRAGISNSTGTFNTFIGVQAGQSNSTGNSNIIMGTNAGVNNTTGSGNFFLGDNAGGSNRSGSFNVFLGANAGLGNDFGFNNMAIGFEANVASGALVNATAIGYRAFAAKSNSLVLGQEANVGIGTSSPTAKLEVVSGVSGTAGLKLSSLTSSFSPSATSNKFLTVDESGNVILAKSTSGGRVGNELWQRNGSFLESTQGESVIIGQGISKMPSDYNLFVSKGILTEKVKVAVKSTSDWSDKVFATDYKLPTLTEVDGYIRQHQHLPGIPSATEVVKGGIDLAKMDAKLLEKIEELTLYSIQQQQQIIQQQKEIDELKRLIKQVIKP